MYLRCHTPRCSRYTSDRHLISLVIVSSVLQRMCVWTPQFFNNGLLICCLLIGVGEVEVFQVVIVLASCNHSNVVPQQDTLQELLGEILQVPLAEVNGTRHIHRRAITTDLDQVAQHASLTGDLESIVQVFLLHSL